MDEVAEAAELSKGTLYLCCKSKDDMAMGVDLGGLASSAILTLVVVPVVDTYVDAMRQKVPLFFRRVTWAARLPWKGRPAVVNAE